MAVYNEIEPYPAQWLRNLIDGKQIADGQVIEGDVRHVAASDVAGQQAHFFAGIGAWSYALRLAGVSDEAPIWTGSCPCQPFSVAGKGKGTEDERHLWPEWLRLIAICLPGTIFGEQVASPSGREWLAGVRFDLENIYYWTAFYENLHDVQEAEKENRLSEVFGQIVGRVEASLLRVSAHVRTEVARKEQGKNQNSKGEAKRKREGVSASVRHKEAGRDVDRGCAPPEQKERDSIQPQSVLRGDRGKDPGAALRNERGSTEYGQYEDRLELPVNRQDRPTEGVRLFKHQDRLLRYERSTWKLGGCAASASSDRVAGNVQQSTTEAFREAIAESVGRDWVSVVRTQMEALGYEVGAADLSAAGVGAPHIRSRLYFGARLGNTNGERARRNPGASTRAQETIQIINRDIRDGTGSSSAIRRLGNADETRSQRRSECRHGLDQRLAGETGLDYWRDVVYLECSDGKARPAQPGHVKMVDGAARFMGYLRTAQNRAEEMRTNNGQESQGSEKGLQAVQCTHDAQEVQRNTRGYGFVPSEGVLRQALHGCLDGGEASGRQDSGAGMRAVQQVKNKAVRPSHQPGCDGQHPIQLGDVVRLMPSTLALAQLHGWRDEKKAMLALRQALCTTGVMQYPPDQVQEAWRSLGHKGQARFAVGFDPCWFRHIDTYPLAYGTPNRVGRLRAYGNAIVAPVAAHFVRAFLDSIDG